MIVIIQKDTQEPALRQLAVRLMNQGVRIGRTPGRDADVLTLVGDTWRLDPEGLAALPYVLDVRRITPPYRLAGRAAHPDNTVVEVGRPKELNMSSSRTSVTMTAKKMTMISLKVNICGLKTPLRAISIMPLEKVAPMRTPRLATIMIVLKEAMREPMAEFRKFTASLLTPT